MSASHAGRTYAVIGAESGTGTALAPWRLSPQKRLMAGDVPFADAGSEYASRGELVR